MGVVQQTLMLLEKTTTAAAAAGSTIVNTTVKDMSLGIELGCKEHRGMASMQQCQANCLTVVTTA